MLALPLFAMSIAQASVVEYSFNNIVSSTGTVGGSSPWLDLKISDTSTPGTLHFDVSTALIGNQNLTGLFLNIPTTLSGNLAGINIANSTIPATPSTPSAFISGTGTSSSNSVYSATQTITSGALGSATGQFDIYIKFAAGMITGPSGTGALQESFDLAFIGSSAPTATSFLTLSAPKSGGSALYALAALTNAGGAASSGTAYLSATPVPLPAAYLLLMGGLGFIRLTANGKRKTQA